MCLCSLKLTFCKTFLYSALTVALSHLCSRITTCQCVDSVLLKEAKWREAGAAADRLTAREVFIYSREPFMPVSVDWNQPPWRIQVFYAFQAWCFPCIIYNELFFNSLSTVSIYVTWQKRSCLGNSIFDVLNFQFLDVALTLKYTYTCVFIAA